MPEHIPKDVSVVRRIPLWLIPSISLSGGLAVFTCAHLPKRVCVSEHLRIPYLCGEAQSRPLDSLPLSLMWRRDICLCMSSQACRCA